jgi:hypothetical protein
MHALPVQQRSPGRVLVEQVADHGGAGARHAQHDQRPLDGCVQHLRVSLDVVVDLHAPAQRVGGVVEDAFAAERGEHRGGVELVEHDGQAVAPRVGIDFAQAGALGRQFEDVVGGRDVVEVLVFAHRFRPSGIRRRRRWWCR